MPAPRRAGLPGGAMSFLRSQLGTSPIRMWVAPYALLIGLTVIQDSFEGPVRYWMYFAKIFVGAWCICEVRSMVPEMRWAFSWEAVCAGVLVCALWIGLDPYYPKIELLFKAGEPWNPFKQFGADSGAAWFFPGLKPGWQGQPYFVIRQA